MKAAGHRYRVPRKVVESPSLETFKSHPDMVLSNWLEMALLQQALDRSFGDPF